MRTSMNRNKVLAIVLSLEATLFHSHIYSTLILCVTYMYPQIATLIQAFKPFLYLVSIATLPNSNLERYYEYAIIPTFFKHSTICVP